MAKKKKNHQTPAQKQAVVNPMKDGPEEEAVTETTEEINIFFESEEVATYAAEKAEEYGLELDGITGTGEDGVITRADIDKAVEIAGQVDEDNNPPSETEKNDEDQAADNTEGDTSDADVQETVDFASDVAGEFYAANKEKIVLADVKGTGKNGSITKGDLEKYLPKEDPAEEEVNEEAEDRPKEDTAESLIEELINFGLPVKGALKNKPLVLQSWNSLFERAIKFRNSQK